MPVSDICEKCGQIYRIGDWPFCNPNGGPHGKPYGGTSVQALHKSERPVIYRNPRTGEVRIPPRADMPMNPRYVNQGYQRVELETMQSIRNFEKDTGRTHEISSFDSKNDSTSAAHKSLVEKL